MRKLWHDIQTHERTALLFIAYWLATLAVVPITWAGGIPFPVVVLLFTTPLIAGFLVGRWRAPTPERPARAGDRIRGGMLAGVLSAEITLLVVKGGFVDEVNGWVHGGRFQGGEVLEFSIATGVIGVFLGLVGAVVAVVLDRFHHHDRPISSAAKTEPSMLRKLIAANELLAGVIWVAMIPFAKPAPHSASDFVQLGCELVLFGATVCGGYLLWRNDLRGYRLSMAVQACQILRLASSRLTFLVTCGICLTFDYAPFVPKGSGRTDLFVGYSGISIDLARISPLSLGVNVVAALCLLWLIRNVRALETREGRAGVPAVFIVTAPVVAGLGLSFFLSPPPIVIFDEDNAIGAGYYDASFGECGGSSVLTRAGPGGDKLPIIAGRASSGSESGLLQWRTSGPAARWRIFVSSPSWHTFDASAYESLTLTVNGPAAIDAANLPWIGLESIANEKSAAVNLAAYLPQGIDADPATWQRITIPLKAFQPYGSFALSQFKAFWFRQGAADDVQHTIWFDEVRLIAKSSTAPPVAARDP